MVLGTAFYPINDPPVNQNIDCDGRGSANFSSYHGGGANFLFADGSVQFLSEQIGRRVFHRLAERDDGEKLDDF
jgi:prepilin-type processing-associated H-X9-DG protein